jgi:twitching motility protein PilT
MIDIKQLLQLTIVKNASDLHIVAGYYPSLRINNILVPETTTEVVTAETASSMLLSLLTEEQKENLLANKEMDFSYEMNGYRFRTNLYFEQGKLAGAFRLIPTTIKTIEELGLPQIIHQFSDIHQGLILLAGPAGEGKSTTLASILNEINAKHAKHIITIEDPIEHTYPKMKSIISQRELQQDTHSWSVALRSALREDPDVIFIGEMRDYETIQAAVSIAETGHLVFSTLHTTTSAETVNRIIDVFPSSQQSQIRAQLSTSLAAVISQRLVPDVSGNGRVPINEILINTPAISSVIRDGRIFMIDNILETSEGENMILFEKALAHAYQRGMITKETAHAYALRPNEIKKFVA